MDNYDDEINKKFRELLIKIQQLESENRKLKADNIALRKIRWNEIQEKEPKPERSFIIRADIIRPDYECYRLIQISDQATLEELSTELIHSIQFDDDHAHVFFMNNDTWSRDDAYYYVNVDDENAFPHTCDYTLRQAGMGQGKKFKFVFDLGANWEFDCQVCIDTD